MHKYINLTFIGIDTKLIFFIVMAPSRLTFMDFENSLKKIPTQLIA